MKNLKYVIGLLIGLLLMLLIQYHSSREFNWDETTFMPDDKEPFGSYVFYQLLPDIFSEEQLVFDEKPIYEFLTGDKEADFNYLLTYDVDLYKEKVEAILDAAYEGGTFFIAAEYIGFFKDTLHIEQSYNSSFVDPVGIHFKDSEKYYFLKYHFNQYYEYQKSNFEILPLAFNQDGQAVFIKIAFGEGCIYLLSSPYPLSNYYMLRGNATFVERCLSYLPDQKTYYRSRAEKNNSPSTGPLAYVLSEPALKWAFVIILIGIALFMIFRAKRKQRAIPIILPPQNTSLEFTQTIGSLYYQNSDHKNIAEKIILYFFEYLRSEYHLNIRYPDRDQIEKIAKKTGKDKEDIEKLFFLIQEINAAAVIREEVLVRLSSMIENFKKNDQVVENQID